MVRSLKQKSTSKPPCPSWYLTSFTSFNSGVSLFPFTCRCAFMYECVCVRERDERLLMGNSLDQAPFSLLRQGIPLDAEITDSTTSTSLLHLPIFCALGLQADHHTCLASSLSWNCRLWSSDLLYSLSHLSIPPTLIVS